MDTLQILNFLSKDVKLKLIIHLYTCHERECDVNDLLNALNEKQANVSKHLGNLKRAGVVKIRKEGVASYYYLAPAFIKKYGVLIEEIMRLVKEDVYQKYTCKCFNDGHEQIHEHNEKECLLNSHDKK
ncbi:ArsR/SmtB family transcription factor [Mycoplasma sp. Sp48II]|uniref:ArsR/SmtB family transcription factor n=1 Tax=unclassified Mycoplasma TaxID=2683645 RepID=UPI003AB0E838